MGYFPNGISFDVFYEMYCDKCIHEPEDVDDHPEDGCPVILAHFVYGYELVNKKDDPGKVILDMLVREMDHRQECMMFSAREGVCLNPWQMSLTGDS